MSDLVEIPLVTSVEEVNRIIKENPKVVFIVTKEGCPFCEVVLGELLGYALGELENWVPMYEIREPYFDDEQTLENWGVYAYPFFIRYENSKFVGSWVGVEERDVEAETINATIDLYKRILSDEGPGT